MATATPYATYASLYNYRTGELLRPATPSELEASIEAARHDGGAGVIEIDGQAVYAQ